MFTNLSRVNQQRQLAASMIVIIVLLLAIIATAAAASSSHQESPFLTDRKQTIISTIDSGQQRQQQQHRSLDDLLDSNRNESLALEDLVDRLLEHIKPSPANKSKPLENGTEKQQQVVSKLNPRRDLSNQTSDTDELFYEDQHHYEADRHIQYDRIDNNRSSASDGASSMNLMAAESHQAEQQPPKQNDNSTAAAAAAAATGADSQAVARRDLAVQGRAMTGLPRPISSHHSKPPYATSDQFQHRSSSSGQSSELAGSRGDANHTTSDKSQIKTTAAAAAAAAANGDDQQVASAVQPEIVNSINRISTNLANDNEVALQPAGQGKPDPLTAQSQQVNDDAAASLLLMLNSRPPLIESLLEKQEFQKLATANGSPTELSPIPFDEPSALNNALNSTGGDGDNFAPEQVIRMYSFYPEDPAHRRPLETNSEPMNYSMAAASEFSSVAQQQWAPASAGPKTTTRLASSNLDREPTAAASEQQQQQLAANSRLGNPVTRKTIEAVSSQLQVLDHQAAYQQEQQQQQQQQQQSRTGSSNMGGIHRASSQAQPTGPYAASLINVTAPMVPPLSATEAMESSLAEQAGGRELLNQVSGLLRPTAGRHSFRPDQPKPADRNRPTESIYLPPANSFAPPPPSRNQADLLQAASISQPQEPYNSTAATTSTATAATTTTTADRRLDGYATNRPRPASLAPIPALPAMAPAQPASGFRYPALPNQQQATQFHHHQQPHHRPASSLQNGIGGESSGPNWHSPAYLTSYFNMPAGGQLQPAATATAGAPSHVQNTTNELQSSQAAPSTTTNGFITNGVSSSASSAGGDAAGQSSNIIHSMSSSTTPASISLATASTAAVSSSTASSSSSGGGGDGTLAGGTALAATTTSNNSNNSNNSNSNTSQAGGLAGLNRRVFNLTRVEHISAECSSDLIRTVIVFNGTFRGMIYSSGYVRDSACIYVNGTGKTKYEFSIRLNQCGTLGRQELHPAGKDNDDIRRRDQVMWNTLSIQYNPIIEQEWDEHFRVSCEYGSDFWKTVSFSPFDVETNTGSPIVFTVDPPQCQMEILRGHGMVGPRQETISGPVTVGDPLTLLIHMKSERAGYDILVKNCIAHDNVKQRMQLIDSNGCVVNERFISPFRGSYNDNDLKHVTLYAYLKAFRFTGSPILYLECEIHMCQNSCPPQMCYWRRLSKRSAASNETAEQPAQNELSWHYQDERNHSAANQSSTQRRGRKMRAGGGHELLAKPSEPSETINLSDRMSLSQSLLVRPLDDPDAAGYSMLTSSSSSSLSQLGQAADQAGELLCYRRAQLLAFLMGGGSLLLLAISVTVACCLQQANKLRQLRRAARGNSLLCSGRAQPMAASSCPSSAPSSPSSSSLSSANYSACHRSQTFYRRPGSQATDQTAAAAATESATPRIPHHHQQQQQQLQQLKLKQQHLLAGRHKERLLLSSQLVA